MRWVRVRCLMLGHDDRIRRVAGRMYLECAECGRETRGWNVTPDAVVPPAPGRTPSRSLASGWRELWWQARRHPFAAVGLR
jgi:hypothetical protein